MSILVGIEYGVEGFRWFRSSRATEPLCFPERGDSV